MRKHAKLKLKWLRFKEKRSFSRTILKLFLIFCASLLILSLALFIIFAKDLPNPKKFSQKQSVQSTKIYDRTGAVLLYDIHGEEKRTVVPFEKMPQSIKDATLAIEDANFYQHFGLDFKGILRALLANIKSGKVTQGGSTITQQFIKNSFLTPKRTLGRKIKELILAIELEIKYSKDEILAFYLNQVPYGSNAYGIEAASQTFFGKEANRLTLSESALLAALTKAPTYFSPFGSHPEELKQRQEYILDRMEKLGMISAQEAQAAKKEKLNFTAQEQGIRAPHFVMYVKEYLETNYGQDWVEKAGLKVITTLDYDLQEAAEEIAAKAASRNEKVYGASNAALSAVDPKTGQILVMVGSRDYFDIKHDGNVNVTLRPRQPGSAFKPFAYALSLKRGFTPETLLFDLPTEFGTGGASYFPQNYDGKFRGPVKLKEGLAQSLNIPSVKVLYLAGISPTIDLAQDFGLSTLKDRNRFGLSLVLGGGEVYLLELTNAYGVFAQEGVYHPLSGILRIEDNKGKIIEDWQDKPKKVLSPQTARQINEILSDNNLRAPIFGAASPLNLGQRPAAVKTGTTQEYRDAWTIGYTPSLSVGVWAGNNDNSPMQRAGAGVMAAGPIWNEFMKKAYEIKSGIRNQESGIRSNEFILPKEIEEFNKPEPIISDKAILNGEFPKTTVKIDKISGKLATDLTPPELIEEKYFLQPHAILYFVDKNNPQGPPPSNPENDPQFFNWEIPVREWAKNNNSTDAPPTDYDDIHSFGNQPKIKIISPQENEIVKSGSNLKIEGEAESNLGIKQIDIFFDDEFIESKIKSPFLVSFNLLNTVEGGLHQIKIKAYDKALNRGEEEITIIVE